MNGLTGSQATQNWRIGELLRVGDDLRHQREADANHGQDHVSRHGLLGWIGRHVVGLGHAAAAGALRRPSHPDLPQVGSATKTTVTTRAIRPQ